MPDLDPRRDEIAEEQARAAVERVRELVADADTWTPYDSRDTGEVFLAESVRDLLDDIRRALEAPHA